MEQVKDVRRMLRLINISFSDDAVIRVPAVLYRERPLHCGEIVERESYMRWVYQHEAPYALDQAIKLLAARERSAREVHDRLATYGYTSDTISSVIEKLEKRGVLSDERYARSIVNARGTKNGRRRIAQDLRNKGIDIQTASSALETIDEKAQLNRALYLVEKYLAHTHGDEPKKIYGRVLGMLARQGFDYETARAAVREAVDKVKADILINDE